MHHNSIPPTHTPGTLIAIGYDNVLPPSTPCVWNIRALFVVGGVLAAVACMSSLLLLDMCLNSWKEESFFQYIGLGGMRVWLYVYVSMLMFVFLWV